jgi:hypothetical protein
LKDKFKLKNKNIVINIKMFYTCEKCQKVFDQKYNYDVHLKRKKPCSIESKLKSEIKNFECEICGDKFTALPNLYRHRKMYCKGPKNQENQENQENDKNSSIDLNSIIDPKIIENYQNSELGKKINLNEIINDPNILKIIGELYDKNITNNLNANIQNNTTNNNNIFILKPFGKEGKIQVPKAILHSLYRNMENAIPQLVEYIHYNDNFPQFQNIEGKGISNSYVSVFDGTNWILQRKDEVYEKLIKDKKEILDDFFDELVEAKHSKLNSKIIRNYNEQSDKLDSFLNREFYNVEPEKKARAFYKSVHSNIGVIMENQKIKRKNKEKEKKNVKRLD